MVGVNFFVHRIGTVAIFATLFVAIYVNGEKDFVFDVENDNLALNCKDTINSWEVTGTNFNKKALALPSGKEGCLKTKLPVALNSSSTITLKFLNKGGKSEVENVVVSLTPVEGVCQEKECVWDIAKDPQFQQEDWVTIEHKFPLTSTKKYYVELHINKNQGNFTVAHIATSGVVDEREKVISELSSISIVSPANQLTDLRNESGGGGGGGHGEASLATGLAEISKNLMLTTASVLTLNNLLN